MVNSDTHLTYLSQRPDLCAKLLPGPFSYLPVVFFPYLKNHSQWILMVCSDFCVDMNRLEMAKATTILKKKWKRMMVFICCKCPAMGAICDRAKTMDEFGRGMFLCDFMPLNILNIRSLDPDRETFFFPTSMASTKFPGFWLANQIVFFYFSFYND